MCNEMQVPGIDWMLWNNQLLVGQILLLAICSLHKLIPRIGFADLQRWFAAICIKILARFSLDFCHQCRLDGRTSHLFAREYFLLLGV
jgi:hypothetical protein